MVSWKHKWTKAALGAILTAAVLVSMPQPASAEWITNPLTNVSIETIGPGGRWVHQAAYMVRTTPMIADIVHVRNVRVITLELVRGNSMAVFVKVYLGAGRNRSYLASFAMGEYMVRWDDWARVVKLHKAIEGTSRYRQLYGARDRRKQEQAAAARRAEAQQRQKEQLAKAAEKKLTACLSGIKSRYEALGFRFVKPELSYSATQAIDEIRQRPVLWEFTRVAQLQGTHREYMTFSVPNSEQEGEHPILMFLVLRKGGAPQFAPDYVIATREGDESNHSVRFGLGQVKGASSLGQQYLTDELASRPVPQPEEQQDSDEAETASETASDEDGSDDASVESAPIQAPHFKPTWSLAELYFTGDLASRPLTKRFLPSYPTEGLAVGQEGDVGLRAHVRPDGSIDRVDIVQSSGKSEFDDTAQQTLMKWSFQPIAAAAGTEQIGEIVVRFRVKKTTETRVEPSPQ